MSGGPSVAVVDGGVRKNKVFLTFISFSRDIGEGKRRDRRPLPHGELRWQTRCGEE
jgi:hypothetical protein